MIAERVTTVIAYFGTKLKIPCESSRAKVIKRKFGNENYQANVSKLLFWGLSLILLEHIRKLALLELEELDEPDQASSDAAHDPLPHAP